MKNIFFTLFASIISFSTAFAQDNLSGSFQLNAVVISNKPAYKVYFSYPDTPGTYLYKEDSALVQNGHFIVNLKLNEPVLADVNLVNKNKKSIRSFSLFLDPHLMNITIKDSVVVTNSALNDYYTELLKREDNYRGLRTLQNKINKPTREQLDSAREKIQADLPDSVYKPFIVEHLNDYMSLYTLNLYAASQIDVDKVLPLYKQLNKKYKAMPLAIALKKRIDIAANCTVGHFAPDFEQPDTAGNPVKLSSFKGKYLLLDFWASWCAPCRRENPEMVKIYNLHKNQNFSILSVSDDTRRSNWVKAIKQDHLAWTHVSDLKFMNTILELYNIGSIPQNYLISPAGKIIAKNLHGEELEEKLNELLKN